MTIEELKSVRNAAANEWTQAEHANPSNQELVGKAKAAYDEAQKAVEEAEKAEEAKYEVKVSDGKVVKEEVPQPSCACCSLSARPT